MAINRREFTALIAGGLLFPQKIIQAAVRPQLPARITDDHPQDYSFTFSCETPAVILEFWSSAGSAPYQGYWPVYELWQPGIVIELPPAGPHHPVWIYDRKDGYIVAPGRECDSLYWALETAPAFSFVVYDGVAHPYRAVGEFQDHPWISGWGSRPLLLGEGNCQALVKQGKLEACKPFTTRAAIVSDDENFGAT